MLSCLFVGGGESVLDRLVELDIEELALLILPLQIEIELNRSNYILKM